MIIPADLASWHPNDVQDWLAALNEDLDVTDVDYAAASDAVGVALVGDDWIAGRLLQSVVG